MGFGGISIWQLLIILAIIVLIFGTKRMRNLGSDLGNALRGFRKAVKEEPTEAEFSEVEEDAQNGVTHQPDEVTVKKTSTRPQKTAAKGTSARSTAKGKATTASRSSARTRSTKK